MAKRTSSDGDQEIQEVEQSLAEIERRTKVAQLQKAEMELEMTEDSVRSYKAQKEARSRANQQRQSQLRKDNQEIARHAIACTHRQGGPLKSKSGGKGPSALKGVVLPDERELIMCAICRLRVFSPNPSNGAKKRRAGESADQQKARMETFEKDLKEFERLKREATDQLTEEAGRPMHCGVTFRFEDGEGNQVRMPAPCDEYAQGLDNRKAGYAV